MFSKRSMFKSLVVVAVAASIAVAGAKSAKAGNPYNPNAYVYGGASQQVAQSIQSAGNGSQRSVSAARSLKPARVQGFRIITDTLGGNGTAKLVAPRAATTPAVTAAVEIARHLQHEDMIDGGSRQVTSGPVVSHSIQSQDRELQRFVTAGRNLRAVRAHPFTIITDTLGGSGHAVRNARVRGFTTPNPYQNTGSASAALQGYTTSGPGTGKLLPLGGSHNTMQ